ncbi:MAG TPA: prephenate dehydrogenase/arogenate dehydrogenase family protein, partial [Lachnospiraceae bacterium]|nr:prephenate dehydrogenase/arogenate dehydrogenase family protein [Lachnospiraceae bacterium]
MKYGFIGLGLIGGSLARNLKKLDPACTICAYTRTQKTSMEAREAGVLDEICTSPSDELFRGCDYIFLCAPVITNIRMLSEIRTVLGKKTILTDVGSVKTGIHQEAERLGLDNQFIGGHPMTGSEKTGFESGNDHLFENAYYILTPGKRVPEEWTERYYQLVQSLKALPLVLDYREHDYITA